MADTLRVEAETKLKRGTAVLFTSRRSHAGGFTLLEMLVSTAVLALILFATMSLLNMTHLSYRRVSGNLDSFESARAAFDTLTRTLRQATLLSYLGYDDPTTPTQYQLKSDLHFFSGPQAALGFSAAGTGASHAVFFQAPLGVVDTATLQNSNLLLNTTGFFIGYGDDPLRPAVVHSTENRNRFRLFQFFQPRENMKVYEYTITISDGIPAANDAYQGPDWFASDVNDGRLIHPLADNVVALAILPVVGGQAAGNYLWNSRDPAKPDSHHRLPQALKIVMAAIDEKSAARLGNSATAPLLFPQDRFSDASKFDYDVGQLDKDLAGVRPPINYRIFTAEISLGASNTNL